MSHGNSGSADQTRLGPRKKISEREGQVPLVRFQTGLNGRKNIVFFNPGSQLRIQRTQSLQLTLADHSFRLFHHHAQETVYFAVIADQRAVGKCMVGFLGVSVAFQEQQEPFIPCGLACIHDPANARSNFRPNLRPYFMRRPAKGPRMLLAQSHVGICIVVKEGKIRAPCHPHGIPRADQDADRRFQALRPCSNRPHGSAGPVISANSSAQFTAPGENVLPTGRQGMLKRYITEGGEIFFLSAHTQRCSSMEEGRCVPRNEPSLISFRTSYPRPNTTLPNRTSRRATELLQKHLSAWAILMQF